jgi:hypothetical protein
MAAPLSGPTWLRLGACALALALSCAVPGALWAQPRFDLRSTQTRLPTTVLPSQVQLVLDVDPDRDTFSGEVTIHLRARQVAPSIVLHAQGLQSDSAQLRQGRTTRRLLVQPDEATATWRLTPEDGRPIAAGAYQLHLRYRGQVQNNGEGLFRADFRVQGQPARTLATQLQAVQARRVLPVFDEPVFRSVFDISVRAPVGYEVLSNMPLLHARPEGATVLHRFAPTPAMPSYLLAVAVGRYDVLEDRMGDLPLRIFTAPGKREQARFAMQATQQVLPFYASYFGRPTCAAQAGPAGRARWPSRRDGRLGPDQLHRKRAALRPHAQQSARSAVSSPSWRTRSRTSGSATWCRWPVGTRSGSTKPLPPGWPTRHRRTSTPNGRRRCASGSNCSALCCATRLPPHAPFALGRSAKTACSRSSTTSPMTRAVPC